MQNNIVNTSFTNNWSENILPAIGHATTSSATVSKICQNSWQCVQKSFAKQLIWEYFTSISRLEMRITMETLLTKRGSRKNVAINTYRCMKKLSNLQTNNIQNGSENYFQNFNTLVWCKSEKHLQNLLQKRKRTNFLHVLALHKCPKPPKNPRVSKNIENSDTSFWSQPVYTHVSSNSTARHSLFQHAPCRKQATLPIIKKTWPTKTTQKPRKTQALNNTWFYKPTVVPLL